MSKESSTSQSAPKEISPRGREAALVEMTQDGHSSGVIPSEVEGSPSEQIEPQNLKQPQQTNNSGRRGPGGFDAPGERASGSFSAENGRQPREESPLITFIIPVYKALPWLERSLSSILTSEKKSPTPIELLICDDASPDGTGQLVNRLAGEDPRIVPMHNETNGSVCYSRNRCLSLAKGTWICFVDQDDVLDAHAFEVFRKTLDDESDIIYYGFQDFYDNEPVSMGDGTPGPTREFGADEIKKLQWDCLCRYKDSQPLVSYRLLPVPWGKLYRRSFLNDHNVRFREGLHREEDIGFNLTALAHCTHAKECPYPLYHYRRSLDTQSHTYRPNIRRETDETLAWYREIIAEHYPDDPRMDELYRFRELWGTLYNIALGCGHADNPKPYRERKQDFEDLFTSETLDANKALDPQMIRRLDPLHKILATLARKKNFRAIWLLGKLEPLTYKLKIR